MRPVPPNARLVRLEDVLANSVAYGCIIAHNLTDLLDAKALAGPRLYVIHQTLDSMVREQRSTVSPEELRRAVAQYVRLIGAHVIAVTALKGRSWGYEQDVVTSSADPEDYLTYTGDLARGLRVANHIAQKAHSLLWDFHEKAFDGIPMTIVGHNQDMSGVQPARDWTELKEILSRHRFFVHTADPQLEDGFNMATLEAMAAGLPVLGNPHPTSPVTHGVSGFLSDDPDELRAQATRLLEDRDLAARMGQEATKAVMQKFPPERFRAGLQHAIETAQRKWQQRR
jgi:glycosyltransferase involved in cell wall biosynthesis